MLLKKQLTTAKVCSECRDCCGFYAFAPIVSEEQKNAIVKEKKVSGKNFKRLKDGSWQIVLKPGKVHDYCPFFINEMCAIHELKPFDCELYPFSLMWSKDKKRKMLVVDEDCIAVSMAKGKPAFNEFVEWLKNELRSDEIKKLIKKAPSLVEKYQEGYLYICDVEF